VTAGHGRGPSRGQGPADLPGVLAGVLAAPDAVTPAPEQPRRAWVEQIMGMPVSFHVRGPLARAEGPAARPLDEAVARAIADLHRTNDIFSTYQADSEISRLRRGELTPAGCDPWVREVIDLCTEARARTGGWFDAVLPDDDGVRRFNPTGLVKGWAVERVTSTLSADLPDHDVLVNAGGDIAVRCRRTDTPDWVLGIEDPVDRTRMLATVPLRTGSLATSGTAARGAHILDPSTGRPVDRVGSVTVIGPDLMWADVHATAAFAMGDEAPAHLARLAGHLSFVVRPDGTTATLTGPPIRSTRKP
jgi:thiamine biosynthesis lipoprotein